MRLRAALPLAAMFVVAGCSFFSKSKSTFYSLDHIAPATPPAAATSVRIAPIGIDALEVPPDLNRREIVVRQADQKLDIRANEQWSANFQELVLHTLAFDLANRLPEGAVVLPGEPRPNGAVRSMNVVFEELAAGPEPRVVLDARWTLGDVSHHERVTVDIASLDSVNVAKGVSQAVAGLADRIAGEVRR